MWLLLGGPPWGEGHSLLSSGLLGNIQSLALDKPLSKPEMEVEEGHQLGLFVLPSASHLRAQ